MSSDAAIHIKIPRDVGHIIDRLSASGYSAYVVGGSVRDSLLGRTPVDWDITTSARPEEIKAIFGRTVDTGIKHGTVTVLMGGAGYEITTFRVDGDYTDSRHPDSVSFTRSLSEDLRRRDFTVNAIAYSRAAGIIDPYGGREDLAKRIIRAVGDPFERFHEDALRMLRAVRLAAQLEFGIEEGTRKAVSECAEGLKHVSRERIAEELTRLIVSDHIEMAGELFELGLAPYISENFEKVDTLHLGFQSVPCPEEKHMRLAFLLEGLDAQEAYALMRGLRLDNITIRKTMYLVSHVSQPLPADRYHLKKLLSETTPELFLELLKLKEVGGEEVGEARESCLDIMAKGEPVYMGDLALTGRDIIEQGIAEGPQVGLVMDALLDSVQREPSLNTREALTKELKIICD